MTELYDITIIGGGPVGLFTAFYSHLRQAKVKIIDSLPQLGGQPAILYPEKKILDIPAFPHLTGQELTDNLLAQLAPFETSICLNETVTGITQDHHFSITTSKGEHASRAIIIAMGNGAFKPRPLEIKQADDFENIHYHVENIQQYANQNVVVLGGGDSAVDWSLAFDELAESTQIVHRRDNFRAMEHSVEALKTSNVTIHTPYMPQALQGGKKHATAIELTKVKSNERLILPFDHLFVNYGFKSSVGTLKEWGLDLQRNRILVNSKQETSIPGIYAVGDCCSYQGKVDLIATGLGEAPTAVNNAMHFINPTEKVQPRHSSSL
ncbi:MULTISPECIES: NAD(P)/FAD-dependent oxidoreductase [unclassified Streptococcus]|uniref:NAD(P)/FAD-dependent oxidoreductase n=1 Tax=unclassified Streptococcus TaxID=2608887 RepID=UPI0010729796|nr:MULTISPECIES: NAD(P)/FAD-dependent oxidoreductase [unclassified Streptococcus]MBF0788047.1 NAD(P)/FAD-dependent oxidoreductase [Streptococcus sp. 19428wC2_LYSM12]MCQ9211860.1 NAD(P)/FAD-dependent oxidoreductase [Streptococcus sp. B01]MCQ9212981.1 NAD(P)/FAD-dependent oxidoreductase [Streptococcus sp. O1]TFV04919.1 NAD(P)/FAD-dependent oxidoreductase [Streptococcus sp. LYSM12]